MKNSVIIFSFLCLSFFSSLAQTKSEILVKDLETKRFEALVKNDFNYLDMVFSDDLVYLHSNGSLDDKNKYIGNLKSGKSGYEEITSLGFITKEYDKNVVINRGKVRLKIKSPNHDAVPFEVYFTTVYIKKGSTWRCVSWQATRLPI